MYFQVPKISISPAPPEVPAVEPYSPFAFIPRVQIVDNDSFRPVLLTPPPTVHHFKREDAKKHLIDDFRGIGLESQRFQQLLKATRERNSAGGLRKELAVKIQKNKQGMPHRHRQYNHLRQSLAERRAVFLSKLQAPPSPTATTTPKTPPESPTVLHYTLPSPGLTSPLALFESVDKDSCEGWVEEVYFEKQGTGHDLTNHGAMPEKRRTRLRIPSLEQISARMIPSNINPSDYDLDVHDSPSPAIRSTPLIGVGRLRIPLRTPQPQPQKPTTAPPLQPSSLPKIRVTAVVEEDTATGSIQPNSKLTETNLNAFNVRGQRAHDMLCTLRRRTSSFAAPSRLCDSDGESRFKRHSAPAEMASHPRVGFAHSVLASPGSF